MSKIVRIYAQAAHTIRAYRLWVCEFGVFVRYAALRQWGGVNC